MAQQGGSVAYPKRTATVPIESMGKGGNGKGWSLGKSWHHRSQWQGNRHDAWTKPTWHHEPQRHEASLSNLCGGVLSSAWEGVCNGVAAAAAKAVEHTASTFFKPKASLDTSGKSFMSCLAGKSDEAVPTNQPTTADKAEVNTAGPLSTPDQVMLSILELQKQQMQQQTLLQQQVLRLQETATIPASQKPPTDPTTRRPKTTPTSSPSTPASTPEPDDKHPARRVRAKLTAKAKPKANVTKTKSRRGTKKE